VETDRSGYCAVAAYSESTSIRLSAHRDPIPDAYARQWTSMSDDASIHSILPNSVPSNFSAMALRCAMSTVYGCCDQTTEIKNKVTTVSLKVHYFVINTVTEEDMLVLVFNRTN